MNSSNFLKTLHKSPLIAFKLNHNLLACSLLHYNICDLIACITLQFVAFLERLSRTLNMDELTQDVGIELHTESIIHRAEQLSRLESDKIVDKVS